MQIGTPRGCGDIACAGAAIACAPAAAAVTTAVVSESCRCPLQRRFGVHLSPRAPLQRLASTSR